MTAMAVVLAVGMALWLLITHTKRFLIVAACLVTLALAAVAAIVGPEYLAERDRKASTARIAVTISYTDDRCTAEFPLLVSVVNNSEKRLDKVEFTVVGREPGRSDAVYKSSYQDYGSDRIVSPREGYNLCFAVPGAAYGIPKWRAETADLPTIEWSVVDMSATFQK